jgi:hypothetical protein
MGTTRARRSHLRDAVYDHFEVVRIHDDSVEQFVDEHSLFLVVDVAEL